MISDDTGISDDQRDILVMILTRMRKEQDDIPLDLRYVDSAKIRATTQKVNQIFLNFSFKAVSENDVTKVMRKMKTSHGSVCDSIASFFIKISLPLISGSLCDLFNLPLFSEKFPTDWKIARVAPIYKSGAKDDCSNYRPISVLPVLSRAFEKVVYNQLYNYLDSNRLIYKHQSGF